MPERYVGPETQVGYNRELGVFVYFKVNEKGKSKFRRKKINEIGGGDGPRKNLMPLSSLYLTKPTPFYHSPSCPFLSLNNFPLPNFVSLSQLNKSLGIRVCVCVCVCIHIYISII